LIKKQEIRFREKTDTIQTFNLGSRNYEHGEKIILVPVGKGNIVLNLGAKK